MEMQLEDSVNRIGNARANADEIISQLQQLIDKQKKAHVFPFTWNLKMYRSPPKREKQALSSRRHN